MEITRSFVHVLAITSFISACSNHATSSSQPLGSAAIGISSATLFSQVHADYAANPDVFTQIRAIPLAQFFAMEESQASDAAVTVDGLTFVHAASNLQAVNRAMANTPMTLGDLFSKAQFDPSSMSAADLSESVASLRSLIDHTGVFTVLGAESAGAALALHDNGLQTNDGTLEDQTQRAATDDQQTLATTPAPATGGWSATTCKTLGRVATNLFFSSAILATGSAKLFHMEHHLKYVAVGASSIAGLAGTIINTVPSWLQQCGR